MIVLISPDDGHAMALVDYNLSVRMGCACPMDGSFQQEAFSGKFLAGNLGMLCPVSKLRLWGYLTLSPHCFSLFSMLVVFTEGAKFPRCRGFFADNMVHISACFSVLSAPQQEGARL